MAGQTKGDAATRWVLVGAPLDCSGTDRGKHAPPGRSGTQGSQRGPAHVTPATSTPRSMTRTATCALAWSVSSRSAGLLLEVDSQSRKLLDEGGKPLVVGGDCTVLVGALAAAKERLGRVGLAFVDGHLDYFGGETSPSGEAADMDLAFVTGYGPEGLVDLAGPPPIAEPGDVVVMGHRTDPEEGGPKEALAKLSWWTRGSSWSRRRRSNAGIPRGWGAMSPRGSRRKRDTSGCTSTWTSSTKRRCRP